MMASKANHQACLWCPAAAPSASPSLAYSLASAPSASGLLLPGLAGSGTDSDVVALDLEQLKSMLGQLHSMTQMLSEAQQRQKAIPMAAVAM